MADLLGTDLENVKELLVTVIDYLNRLELYPRGRGIALDAVMLAIVSKNIRVGEAICLLVEQEFHSEAFAMSRTMLELALSARHTSNDDERKRSATFANFFAKDQYEWAKIVSKYYPNAVPNVDSERRKKMIEVAKQFKDPHRWSGKSVRELAMEVDTFERLPDGSPFVWEFDYEAIYKWTSHYVHGTVVAVDEHASGPLQPFTVKHPVNVDKAEMALFNLVLYLSRTFLAAFRSINHEMSQGIIDKFNDTLKRLVH